MGIKELTWDDERIIKRRSDMVWSHNDDDFYDFLFLEGTLRKTFTYKEVVGNYLRTDGLTRHENHHFSHEISVNLSNKRVVFKYWVPELRDFEVRSVPIQKLKLYVTEDRHIYTFNRKGVMYSFSMYSHKSDNVGVDQNRHKDHPFLFRHDKFRAEQGYFMFDEVVEALDNCERITKFKNY